ncbi:MAG: S1/P1 Nuclease [Sphingobacteriales bacterium]|nr:MAG: S1/P1 Nuclease [Sphingobacteriales bacterium]
MKLKYYLPVCTLFLSFFLLSWGVIGHRTIGKIAENNLSAKAKLAVKNLLGTETLPLVTTFADELRPYQEFDYTSKWHYINAPEGLNYKQFVAFLNTDTVPNVYTAVLAQIRVLKDVSKTSYEKKFALKFLVHLVGDLHQPMHVSRAVDKGGNDIEVKFLNRKSNLHSVWDTGLIEYYGFSYTEMSTAFGNTSVENIKNWQQDELSLWIYESYKISEQLYTEVEKNKDLDYDYFSNHSEIVKKRLLQGGIRLAGLLNNIYK